MTSTEKLPAVIASRGGVLAQVLTWDQHLSLSQKVKMSILLIVDEYPELDTESSIDMLAEAAGRYGESLDRWFGNLVAENGIDTIYLTIEAMEHLGLRSKTSASVHKLSQTETEELRLQLDTVIAVFAQVKEARTSVGLGIDSVESFCTLIEFMGGWEAAKALNTSEMIDLLDNNKSRSDYVEEASDGKSS